MVVKMRKGRLTMEIINSNYNLIGKTIGYRLFQHNCDKDNIICLRIVDNIYCYTNDSIFYTICNKVKYEWYSLSE
jgi:hypothetical protein